MKPPDESTGDCNYSWHDTSKEYDVRFDENTGLNIGLRQRGSQLRPGKVAAVRNARRRRIEGAGERMGSGRGRDGGETSYSAGGRGPETGAGGEQTIVFKVPPELRSQVKNESVLLAINSMPVRASWDCRRRRKLEDTRASCG